MRFYSHSKVFSYNEGVKLDKYNNILCTMNAFHFIVKDQSAPWRGLTERSCYGFSCLRSDKVEMIFSNSRFFQKTNKRIQLYYNDTSGRHVFIRFLEEIEDTKQHFEIN